MMDTLLGVAIVLAIVTTMFIGDRYATRPTYAQGPPPPPPIMSTVQTVGTLQGTFADVVPEQNLTVVVLRETAGADQMIVTTFFKQKLPGLDQPILRSVTDVASALKDVPIGVNGSPDPKAVTEVHISLVKIVGRMEWKPAVPTVPSAVPQPDAK